MKMHGIGLGLLCALVLGGCGGGEEPCVGCLDFEICDNGVDDDGNGFADCEDIEACAANPGDPCYVEPPPCEAGREGEMLFLKATETTPGPFTLVSLGLAESDVIAEPGDRDCFAFQPTTGTSYVLYLEHRGNRPDTVLQIFDADFNLIGENDDLPYRITETDSGMEFTALSDETLYFQVLDFSDWSRERDAEGGSNYRYDILLSSVMVEEPNEDTANDNDTFQNAAANTLDKTADVLLDPYVGELGWLPGRIGEAGDVDIIPLDLQPFQYCQVSTFPHFSLEGWSSGLSALSPVWEIFYEDCDRYNPETCTGETVTRVARTENPAILSNDVPSVFFDAGISLPVPSGSGQYYLRVTDANGQGSASHAYSLISDCTSAFIERDDENGSADPRDAEDVGMDDGTTVFTGTVAGFLDGSELDGPDVLDSFRIDEGPQAGWTMDVFVETSKAGSLLTDAVVTVYKDNGDKSITELASTTGDNPQLTFQLTDASDLFLTFASASGADGLDQFYVANITISEDPL
ncbi:MAG: hypothetical protein AAGA48_18820 [Myxococcota bacterium]